MTPEILLIEDEITADVVKLIKDVKKENLNILALGTEDALEKVKSDFNNQISVLIVDFTHKYNPDITKPINPEYYLDEYYQYEKQKDEDMIFNMQGFTFIEEALKTNRKYKFVAYTNCPRNFLAEVKGELNVNIEIGINKEFFNTEDGRKNAISYLKEQIKLNRNTVLHLDTFKEELRAFLTWHYELPDTQKEKFEADITKKAKLHIKKFNSLVSSIGILTQGYNPFFIYKNNEQDFIVQSSVIGGSKSDKRLYIERITKIVDVLIRLMRNGIVDFNRIKEELAKESAINQANSDFLSLNEHIQKIIVEKQKKNKNFKSSEIAKIIFAEIKNQNLIESLMSSIKITNSKPMDFNDQTIIESYKKKLIIRRFAIYLYYWLESISYQGSYGKSVNKIITHGLLDENAKDAVQVTNTSLFLNPRNNKTVSKLIDIALTREEEEFFKNNFPVVYNKWL